MSRRALTHREAGRALAAAGTVTGGTETFTILLGTTVIGSPVTVNVSAGAASASYALPAGTSAGTYIIEAVYSGTTNFLDYTDESQTLVISAAATASATASASATFNTGAQSVNLSTQITSVAGTVTGGTETFTILLGTTVIGTPVTVNVRLARAGEHAMRFCGDIGRHVHHRGGLQRHD